MKLLIINPNTTAALTDKIAGIARGAAAPGTEIIAATAPFGASYISTQEESAVAVDAVLEVIAGHEGGFDGAVIASSSDSGLEAAVSATPKPVTAMTKAALNRARRLGTRIWYIGFQEIGLTLMPKLAAAYGLEQHLAGVSLACRLGGGVAPDAAALRGAIEAAGTAAISESGADVLIVGGAAAADHTGALAQALGVPVLDGITSAVMESEAKAR